MDIDQISAIQGTITGLGVSGLLFAFVLYGIREHQNLVDRYISSLEKRIERLELRSDNKE